MDTTLEMLFRLAQSTSGRRLRALQQAREVALDFGMTALVQRIDTAIADDRETRALDNRWDSRGTPTYAAEVPEIDNWVDQLLTSIRDQAQSYLKDVLHGTAHYMHAKHFLAEAFPNKLPAITSLPYVEQVAAVEALLVDFNGRLAADVAALNLGVLVQRLAELTADYRAAVNKDRGDLDFATVQTARKRGQRNLLEVVAMIIGAHSSGENPVHVTRRTALLAPILEQDRQIRAYNARRRAVPDIDPDAPDDDGGAPDGDGSGGGSPSTP